MTMLSNKVAIITGASSGLGRASARLFAQEGAKVIVGARRKEELNALVEALYQKVVKRKRWLVMLRMKFITKLLLIWPFQNTDNLI